MIHAHQNKTVSELIETALAQPDNESIAAAADARFDEKIFTLKRQMDAGVSPQDYTRLETVRNALERGKYIFQQIRAAEAHRLNS